jgi:hypothetical protein
VSWRLWFRRRRVKPLQELVSEEIAWYWWTRLGFIGKLYLLISSILSISSSLLTVYILFHPLVVYDGYTLSGYISPLSYSLRVAGIPAKYPVLDSLVSISIFMLVYAAVTGILGALGVIGAVKEWRSWVAFAPSSTASASLLVSLLYSLLRLASIDAIPSIPYTVTITSTGGGRVYLNPPIATYSWTYYLPWRPIYFFTAFNILVAFTAGSIILLLLKPKTPVARARIRRKSEVSNLNPLLSKLRGLFNKGRGGSM